MQDKKKIVIGVLCALIMIMAVGYALLSQQLSITGSASITSSWQVEITKIEEKEKSTGTTTNSTNYTATTASFNTSLTSPGDYAIYEVTVTNKGTLDAVLAAKPTVTSGNNEAITYELEGIKKGDKILKNNQTDTFTIKVQYNPAITTQPSVLTSDIEVTLNYQQDLGQVVVYDTYSIGDKVTFAGSDWYVIKDSSEEEDYIIAIKERALTHTELGNYAITPLEVCSEMAVSYHSSYFGTTCTTSGQTIIGPDYDTTPYYFSATCHGSYTIGETTYNGWDSSGCENHNDYEGSKVKEFLEGTYINTIGANKLKEVDEYKVRLITIAELQRNFGVEMYELTGRTLYRKTENTPTWIYQNYGERQNNVYGYWTMTPRSSQGVWSVGDNWGDSSVNSSSIAIRPVINLYKSAIE